MFSVLASGLRGFRPRKGQAVCPPARTAQASTTEREELPLPEPELEALRRLIVQEPTEYRLYLKIDTGGGLRFELVDALHPRTHQTSWFDKQQIVPVVLWTLCQRVANHSKAVKSLEQQEFYGGVLIDFVRCTDWTITEKTHGPARSKGARALKSIVCSRQR